jgi:VWFA-related protein
MGIRLKYALALLAAAELLASRSAGLAQTGAAVAPGVGAVATPAAPVADKAEHPNPVPGRVYLDVVVAPKAGAAVTELTQQEFSILDNKIAQPVASFVAPSAVAGAASGRLVQVILLVDVLNSQAVTLAKVRPELDKFLLANDGKLAYPTTLGVLTENGVHLQPGGSQAGRGLSAALDRYLPTAHPDQRIPGFNGGEEKVQKSLLALAGLLAQLEKQPGRKLVLWVSAGWPYFAGAGMYLDEKQQRQVYSQIVTVSGLLRRAHVTLYCIDPLGSAESVFQSQAYRQYLKPATKPEQADPGDLALQVLATQSGGLVLGSNSSVSELLVRAVADAGESYEIGFDPKPAGPGEYHALQVQVDKPGMVVRTRWGYYGEP